MSKYKPYQNKKEKLRRKTQIEKGKLKGFPKEQR